MRAAAVLFLAAAVPLGAVAQDVVLPPPVLGTPVGGSPILTVDQERLFSQSAFGKRVLTELEAESRTLSSENRRLEAELAAEERELTDLRKTLAPEEFRLRAEVFDKKVQKVRAEQDEKGKALTRGLDRERKRFSEAALPILKSLVEENGAAAILDNRAVLIAADRADITAEAVGRLDSVLGDGRAEAGAQDAPAPLEPAPQQ